MSKANGKPIQFIEDYIWGSGCFQYPWWEDADWDGTFLHVTIHGELDDKVTYHQFTSAQLWKAYQELLVSDKFYGFSTNTHNGGYDMIDLDAGDTDNILQWAIYGEIVYA